jgi:hypothetical protein
MSKTEISALMVKTRKMVACDINVLKAHNNCCLLMRRYAQIKGI